MNLVFDCERMKYPFTGLFEYCAQLGKALQAQVPSGYSMTYYVPNQQESYFGKQGNIIQKCFHKLLPIHTKANTIWHTTYQSSRYMPHNRKVKKVLTIHDLNFLYEKEAYSNKEKYMKTLQRNINKADHIVAISNFVKNDILKNLSIGNKPVSVIYNGCNVAEFPDYDNPVFKPAQPFLLSLGTVVPKKNFHVLPCLLGNNEYELIIAGKIDDAYAKEIGKDAKKFGVEDRVKLIGAINDEDKYWYLKNCAAFLFPSLAEGFGIPPIEAMHFGKPTFLSTATSLPEIGGEYAYYFDDFRPENMRKIFEAGMKHHSQTHPEALIIQHADKFSWKKSAKEYWDVYQSVAGTKSDAEAKLPLLSNCKTGEHIL